MIGNIEYDRGDELDLHMVVRDYSVEWDLSLQKCIKLTNMFVERLNELNADNPVAVMIYEDKKYKHEECIELINRFVSMLNEKIDGTPLHVMVFRDEKEDTHKLDIDAVKKSIYIQREKPNEHLSADEAEAIRVLYKDGYKKAEIARAFGMSRNTINKYCK